MVPFSPPPPPPPPPPELGAVAAQIAYDHEQDHRHSGSNDGLSPSILIITGLVAFVFIASISIHLLLRFLSRRRHRSRRRSRVSHSPATVASIPEPCDGHQKALIDSLPLFSLASSVAAPPKSSPDCAVCLSRFELHDQLRLLPACRHAFHSSCIDTWLRSTPSCPLCRSSVQLFPPNPNPNPNSNEARSERSDSIRLEVGSVSRRRDTPDDDHIGRSYSLGSSFEYVVEEEIEAVVAAVAAHVRRNSSEPLGKDDTSASAAMVAPPGELVAEAAGGSGRGWLKDYVDRLASSASSSFSSMRFSGRWSRRSDTPVAGGGGGSWDLEGNSGDLAPYYSFYRWLVGV